MQWTVPNIDGLRGAFYVTPDGLAPVEGQGDLPELQTRAALTNALWLAVQQLPDTAMMLVKSEAGASIGLLAGGLVFEGTRKINLGLVRAATRALEPQPRTLDVQHTPSATKFRRSLWQILGRLQGANIPRVFSFKFGGVSGQIHSQAGQLRFAGDFTDPASFVAALTAACDADDSVAYTLEDLHDDFAAETFTSGDILTQVVDAGDAGTFEFDPEGWPLSCDPAADFETIKMLSHIAVAACAMSDENGDLTLTALSDANRPRLSGKTTQDRSMELSLSAI